MYSFVLLATTLTPPVRNPSIQHGCYCVKYLHRRSSNLSVMSIYKYKKNVFCLFFLSYGWHVILEALLTALSVYLHTLLCTHWA